MGYLSGLRATWRYTRESCIVYAFFIKTYFIDKVCPTSNKRLTERAQFEKKTLEICRARPRLSGRSLISPWLEVERCVVGFARLRAQVYYYNPLTVHKIA